MARVRYPPSYLPWFVEVYNGTLEIRFRDEDGSTKILATAVDNWVADYIVAMHNLELGAVAGRKA